MRDTLGLLALVAALGVFFVGPYSSSLLFGAVLFQHLFLNPVFSRICPNTSPWLWGRVGVIVLGGTIVLLNQRHFARVLVMLACASIVGLVCSEGMRLAGFSLRPAAYTIVFAVASVTGIGIIPRTEWSIPAESLRLGDIGLHRTTCVAAILLCGKFVADFFELGWPSGPYRVVRPGTGATVGHGTGAGDGRLVALGIWVIASIFMWRVHRQARKPS
jgi:hypothetical protein